MKSDPTLISKSGSKALRWSSPRPRLVSHQRRYATAPFHRRSRYHPAKLGAPFSMSFSSSASARSPDWTVARKAALKRDNYKCVECGTSCGAIEADVHHLLPRSAGGTDELSNLV